MSGTERILHYFSKSDSDFSEPDVLKGTGNQTQRKLRARVGAMIALVVIGIGVVRGCGNDSEQSILSEDEITEACEEAGVRLRDDLSDGVRRSITIINPKSNPDRFLRGLPKGIAKSAVEQADGNVNIVATDLEVARAGQSLAEISEKVGFSQSALECLNGVKSSHVFGQDTRIAVPRATAPNGVRVVIVRPGDTINGLTDEKTEKLLLAKDIDPTKLVPGDLLYLMKKAGQHTAQEVIEPNSDTVSFISTFGEIAQKVEAEYGVPKDVVLAMAILESGYGNSELAINANNFHGLKVNDEWTGDSYVKNTQEHFSASQVKDNADRIIGDPIDIGGGMYEVTIKDTFKKFDSPEAGFMGFGDYLKNRLNGIAYADAFNYTEPIEFVSALFDEDGYKYATDTEYLGKITGIIGNVVALQQDTAREVASDDDHSSEGGANAISLDAETVWNEMSDFSKHVFEGEASSSDKFDSGFDAFKASWENLQNAEVSIEGYENFKNHITFMNVDQMGPEYFSESLYPNSVQVDDLYNMKFMLHYTAWNSDAWGHDAERFLKAQCSVGCDGGGGSANAYIPRDGESATYFRDNNKVVWHVGREEREKYSSTIWGVETPALSQSDITSNQYTALAYLAVWRYLEVQGHKLETITLDQAKDYIIGHGEFTENTQIGDHVDFAKPIADGVAWHFMVLINALAARGQ